MTTASETPGPERRAAGLADPERAKRLRELQIRILADRYEVPALDVADAILAAHHIAWPEDG